MHPRELVRNNIGRFRDEQLSRIGNMFDWTHEVGRIKHPAEGFGVRMAGSPGHRGTGRT
jgi:hypothetical protein